LIFPESNRSKWSMMIKWQAAASNAGIIARANRPSDRRVSDSRRILRETFTAVNYG
jgi:hypothetical protein